MPSSKVLEIVFFAGKQSGIPYLAHSIGKTTMQKAKILSSERFPMNNNVRRLRYLQKLEALKRNSNHQFPVTVYR
ncbi:MULTISPECIES: hypothetical protein [unclassified Arsenophonus]|uniref:hypothetical protein n=1 Tax=unclassified Arsenophonus TaxID=2627083 RepID=UPI00285FB755|nr:hypothetical protein [Arsenophonus sp.]MDR5615530.1 hypothetical protein [Arsenophonus sp.]